MKPSFCMWNREQAKYDNKKSLEFGTGGLRLLTHVTSNIFLIQQKGTLSELRRSGLKIETVTVRW